jgi:uncharacterized protein YecT (DUF1311 family)
MIKYLNIEIFVTFSQFKCKSIAMNEFIYIRQWILTIILVNLLVIGSKNPVLAEVSCNDPQTQAQMNSCASLSATNSDKKLNHIYQQIQSRLNNFQQKKSLTETQRIWIKFRDAQCAFEKSFYSGGSIASTIYYSCLSELTEQRNKQLQNTLNDLQQH